MTFINPLMLFGTALVAMPIVLHLMMRRKPRHFEFPALRFVRRRHDANSRRLRLRHLLLLALRISAIALIAFALARPSIRFSGSWGSQESPVSVALIVDTSLRMNYRHDNRTRLESAQETARELLAQLPKESQIAVLDTRRGPIDFQVDRGAARYRLDRLSAAADVQPIARVLGEAITLVGSSKLAQREVYVFTDLAHGAWPDDAAGGLLRRMNETPEVAVYLIDVGVIKPVNTSLGDVNLSRQILSSGSPLRLETHLAHTGPAAKRTVELYLLDAELKPQKRSERIVDVNSKASTLIEFQLGGLGRGTHQGYLEIVGSDGLAVDDRRYFTVEAMPPWRILLAAPEPAERYATFLAEAIAPDSFRRSGQARFDVEVITLDTLQSKDLSAFAAVCLLDPIALEPSVWRKLGDYASDGHGLALFLGKNAAIHVDSFNHELAQQVMPGTLLRQALAPEWGVYLAPDDLEHPVLAGFRGLGGTVPWENFPVYRYWQLGPTAEGVHTIVSYNDGEPAMLERPLGRGRVVTMTTPVSIQSNRSPWNLLPVGSWPFLILANEMTQYLVGASDQRLNYVAGQTALLKIDPEHDYRSYLLKALDTTESVDARLTPDIEQRLLTVTATNHLGNYRVRAGGTTSGVNRGYSVNIPEVNTELDRVSEEELTQLLGSLPHGIARNIGQLERHVEVGRTGRDLFPLAIILVGLVLAIEHVVANRFYRE